MSDALTPIEFLMNSDPSGFSTDSVSFRNFNKIYFTSDIFNFFPYLEVQIKDSLGLVIDQIFFVEGLKFNVKFGNMFLGYLTHDYCWSESQIVDCKIANAISGTNIALLLSNYYSMDSPKSRSFTQMPLSTVIETILLKDWNLFKNVVLPLNKVNISITDLVYDWNQVNITTSKFIQLMSEVATNTLSPFSPFLTFINSNGEFYFSTIADLFNTQLPVASFTLEMNEEVSYNPDYLKAVEILFTGMPANKEDYLKDIYSITATGDYLKTPALIQLHTIKKPGAMRPIRRSDIKVGDIVDFGITETPQDLKLTIAKTNSLYVDSALSIRANVIVTFHPSLVAGKLVNLTISSALAKKQVGIELSGNWLIIKNEFIYDNSGSAMAKLTLAKSSVTMDPLNPFLKDYII